MGGDDASFEAAPARHGGRPARPPRDQGWPCARCDGDGPTPSLRRPGAGRTRLRRPPAGHRLWPDDLAALHGGARHGAGGAAADGSRAGGRCRQRLPGRRAGRGSPPRCTPSRSSPRWPQRARHALAELGVHNVTIDSFDGGGGWPEHAPYDVIIVSAGAPRIPPLLVEELADGGRLVIPVGGTEEQELAIVRREGDHYVTSHDTRCRYVDLLGRFGVGGAMPAA